LSKLFQKSKRCNLENSWKQAVDELCSLQDYLFSAQAFHNPVKLLNSSAGFNLPYEKLKRQLVEQGWINTKRGSVI
jgi:hypothetical protein